MKLKLISFSAILLSLVGLWSCGPNENQVTFGVEASNIYPTRGDSVTITVSASSELEVLKSIKVEVMSVDTNGNELSFLSETATATDLAYEGSFSFKVGNGVAFGESINVVVTATDAIDGSFENTDNSITAVSYMKVYRSDASAGHQFGPLNGGYNLVEAIEAYRDAPNNTKDMVDKSEQKKELSNTFVAHAESATQFVDLGKDMVITDLHTVSAAKAFAERSPSTLITVSVGTKFMAKLRGGDDYAVVHILEIDPEFELQPTENKGKYVFDIYKLQ
jgi:hypothetical protein